MTSNMTVAYARGKLDALRPLMIEAADDALKIADEMRTDPMRQIPPYSPGYPGHKNHQAAIHAADQAAAYFRQAYDACNSKDDPRAAYLLAIKCFQEADRETRLADKLSKKDPIAGLI